MSTETGNNSEHQQPTTINNSSSERDNNKVPNRVVLNENDLNNLTTTEWQNRWKQQDTYITSLERKLAQQEGELADLRQSMDRTKNQLNEAQQRERVLMRRLTAKEQETQDYVCQLNELKNAQIPNTASLRTVLLDPAVNLILQQLKTELQQTKLKLEDTQNELTAWKFTPDSNTGKRLMAKCRLLYQENEELGKITSSGRIAKLESDLALQKSFSEEVRKSQNELDSFLADLDEDVEGMQSTILFLQQELRKQKDTTQVLQKENMTLKLLTTNGNSGGRSNGDNNNSNSVVVCGVEQDNNNLITRTTTTTDSSDTSDGGCGGGGGGDVDDEDDHGSNRTTRGVKRVRRSSVLSIEYNEDDALVINANGDAAISSDPE